MMGIKDRSFTAFPRDISLDELVPEDNFYRRLQSTLDLSFVRDLVRPLYAGAGRPSVDPVVFFKLQLVMFFEDLRSERQLMSVVADRLSLRWYLGYNLHEPLPDHSSLARIRKRYGLSVFRRFFERIVEMCFEAGLVRSEELYFDATKVEANASLDSTRSRSLFENLENCLKEHLEEIFSEQTPFTQDADVTGITAVVGPTDEKRRALAQKNARQHRWISKAGSPAEGGSSVGLQANGGSQGEHYRSGRLAHAAQEQRHVPAGVPDTLRGGRGQGASNLGCTCDPCGGYREPPHAGSPLQELFSLALTPSLGHRRCCLRYH